MAMRALVVLASASACSPLTGRSWILGATHKTGTVLVNSVMRETDAEVLTFGQLLKPEADVPTGAIQVSNHLKWSNDTVVTFLDWAKDRKEDLRIAIFVRDPLEVILSAYFYHLRTDEWWVHEVMASNPMWDYFGECQPEDPQGRGDSVAMAGCEIQKFHAGNFTYQQMLNAVDVTIGIAIEARRSYHDISSMNKTFSVLKKYPHVARIYDLDDVTSSSEAYDANFADLFDFLGVDDVAHCVDQAAKYDLRRETKSALLAHTMASSMTTVRDALRVLIRKVPWFQHNIQPSREAMNYAYNDE
mmetsp:Transcript_37498/g.120295  ORF Transcript_37498/g.120295 Transcript_37498/m.120295 type:complete len:302 (+) Transcript_37498:62-967(+)